MQLVRAVHAVGPAQLRRHDEGHAAAHAGGNRRAEPLAARRSEGVDQARLACELAPRAVARTEGARGIDRESRQGQRVLVEVHHPIGCNQDRDKADHSFAAESVFCDRRATRVRAVVAMRLEASSRTPAVFGKSFALSPAWRWRTPVAACGVMSLSSVRTPSVASVKRHALAAVVVLHAAAAACALGACATKDGPGRGPNDPNTASQPGSPGDVSNINELTKPSPGATHGVTGDPPEGNPQLNRTPPPGTSPR